MAKRLLLKIWDVFFSSILLFSRTIWRMGRKKSAAEVQVIFIFIHQGSSLSLQTGLHENIRWWVESVCYSQLQPSQSLRYWGPKGCFRSVMRQPFPWDRKKTSKRIWDLRDLSNELEWIISQTYITKQKDLAQLMFVLECLGGYGWVVWF